MSPPTLDASPVRDGFRHEAFLYSDPSDFLDGTVSFLRDGIAADERALVVVDAPKIASLRGELGDDADAVGFADMDEVGRNPARIIPFWREFVDERGSGRRARGIGEPIGPTRRAPELRECQRHEALLNVAFAGVEAWWLLCPYDTRALDAAVIDEARATHPFVLQHGRHVGSDSCRDLDTMAAPCRDPLPEPVGRPDEMAFDDLAALPALRAFVTRRAAQAGFDPTRAGELALAVHELATNSIRHGGGRGSLQIWREGGSLICEISDRGLISDPLAGRRRPDGAAETGRGLWLVHQLSDLVQIRSRPGGTVVRLHLHPTSAGSP